MMFLKDQESLKMLINADKDLDKLKSFVKEIEDIGGEVPSYIKKYLQKKVF
jgi:hypothetical protein